MRYSVRVLNLNSENVGETLCDISDKIRDHITKKKTEEGESGKRKTEGVGCK